MCFLHAQRISLVALSLWGAVCSNLVAERLTPADTKPWFGVEARKVVASGLLIQEVPDGAVGSAKRRVSKMTEFVILESVENAAPEDPWKRW